MGVCFPDQHFDGNSTKKTLIALFFCFLAIKRPLALLIFELPKKERSDYINISKDSDFSLLTNLQKMCKIFGHFFALPLTLTLPCGQENAI